MTGLAQLSSGEVMLCFNNSFLQWVLITRELHLPTKALVRFLGSLCFESSKAELKGSLQRPLETDLNKQITGSSSQRIMNRVITAVYIPTSKPSNQQVRFIKAFCVLDISNPQSTESSVPFSTDFTAVWRTSGNILSLAGLKLSDVTPKVQMEINLLSAALKCWFWVSKAVPCVE